MSQLANANVTRDKRPISAPSGLPVTAEQFEMAQYRSGSRLEISLLSSEKIHGACYKIHMFEHILHLHLQEESVLRDGETFLCNLSHNVTLALN